MTVNATGAGGEIHVSTPTTPIGRAATALALVLALTLALGFAPAVLAQSEDDASTGDDQAATPEAEAESPPEPATPYDTVATVDGEALQLGALVLLKRDLPQQYQQLPDEILAQGLTQQLIDQTLMARAAREAGLDEAPETAFALANRERGVLAEAYMRREIEDRLTEERLREVYETQYAEAEPERQIRASHILVEEKETADEIRAALDAGEDFAALAEEHGTDGTASRGGDLGFFSFSDMVPEFAEAAFALEAGEVGGPVESPFGWHLIKVVDTREAPVPPFEQVASDLARQLQQEIQREIVDELRAEAAIETPANVVTPGALSDPALFEAAQPAEDGESATE